MNRVEAKWLLLRQLVQYRRNSYEELQAMIGDSKHIELTGPTGTDYQVVVDFVWDDKPGGDIRVLGSIDDGGWRAFCPPGHSDLKSPPNDRR